MEPKVIQNSTQTKTVQASHLGYLDSLRALLAILVVITHFIMGWNNESIPAQWGFLSHARNAVCGFIVLSGFCLMIPVSRSGEIRGGYMEFIRRRVKRIIPPYMAFVLIQLLFNLALSFRDGHLRNDFRTQLVDVLLLRDFWPFIDNSASGVLWTVCIEWKLYFAFPLMVLILKKWGNLALLGFALVFTLFWSGILYLVGDPHTWDHSSPWYTILFAMGMIACEGSIGKANSRRYHLVLLGVGSIALIAINGAHEGVQGWIISDLAFGTFFASILYVLSSPNSVTKIVHGLRRLLETRPLVFVGQYGYSIYLYHLWAFVLVIPIARRIAGLLKLTGDIGFLLVLLISLTLSLSLCYVAFLVFEKPTLRKKTAIKSAV